MARRRATVNKRSRPGRLRIVAGKWRSRLLPIEDLPGLRPTSERVRETLFNWLSQAIVGTRCIDLFAGTGALGFEALSRGAASVTFVEKSAQAVRGLRSAASELDASNARIEQLDALALLQTTPKRRYDIVFLDPPFSAHILEECCQLLHSKDWLQRDALVYLEQDGQHPPVNLPRGWQVYKEKTAGNVRYQLVRVTDEGESA